MPLSQRENMMSIPDLKNFTAAQLRELLNVADSQLKVRLAEELSKIVDDLVVRAGDCGITLADIVNEIKRRDASVPVKDSKPAKTKAVKNFPWVKDVTYCNPADNNQTWLGGTKGPKPPWLGALIPQDMPFEEMRIKYLGLVKL